jgi:hypothetical protein
VTRVRTYARTHARRGVNTVVCTHDTHARTRRAAYGGRCHAHARLLKDKCLACLLRLRGGVHRSRRVRHALCAGATRPCAVAPAAIECTLVGGRGCDGAGGAAQAGLARPARQEEEGRLPAPDARLTLTPLYTRKHLQRCIMHGHIANCPVTHVSALLQRNALSVARQQLPSSRQPGSLSAHSTSGCAPGCRA